jgi:hypothetical protein
MTLEEFTEKQKKKVLIKALKLGREPKRSGLFLRLADLVGARHFPSSTTLKLDPKKHDGYDRAISIFFTGLGVQDITDKRFVKVYQKHLGDFDFKRKNNHTLLIRYKGKNVNWYKLDFDLLQRYPEQCYEKDGAIFRR